MMTMYDEDAPCTLIFQSQRKESWRAQTTCGGLVVLMAWLIHNLVQCLPARSCLDQHHPGLMVSGIWAQRQNYNHFEEVEIAKQSMTERADQHCWWVCPQSSAVGRALQPVDVQTPDSTGQRWRNICRHFRSSVWCERTEPRPWWYCDNLVPA